MSSEIDNYKKCQSEIGNLRNQSDTHGKSADEMQAEIDRLQAQLVQRDQENQKLLEHIKELDAKLSSLLAEHKKQSDIENAEINSNKGD